MTHIDDLFHHNELRTMIDEGYVRAQHHPDLPYAILNYTEKAAFEGVWNAVTLNCRGLITTDHGDLRARPFRKFFNHGQTGAPEIDLNALTVVTDKADGSLGILYPVPGGHAIATRGSFTSDQAIHATALWQSRYSHITPPDGVTMLFEIVYPANRIVLDYEGMDDLILLGGVDIATGRSMPPTELDWPGHVTETFPYGTLAEALAAPPRPNAEGLVVHCLQTDERIKLKQDDYVRLHRIVTGLNARLVWELFAAGKPLDDLFESLPDEFHDWVKDVADQLTTTVDQAEADAVKAYAELTADLDSGWTRKDFAMRAGRHPLAWALFALLDGKDIRPKLWSYAKPEAFWTPAGRRFGEDTA